MSSIVGSRRDPRPGLQVPQAVVNVAAPLLVAAAFLGLWQSGLIHRALDLREFAVPYPADIVSSFVDNLGHLLGLAGETFRPALLGLVIAETLGFVAAGLLLLLPRTVGRWAMTAGSAVQAVPSLATAALISFWIDSALLFKVAVVVIMVTPSMLVYAFRGFTSAPADALELMDSYSASRWQIWWNVQVPHSVPYVFTQARYAMIVMLAAVVISEVVETRNGLGYELQVAFSLFDTAYAWASVLMLALLGVLGYVVVGLVERFLFGWATRHSRN
jgi:NitT/TauT family transport system permease protein